jgi:RimJ/RimL family protein N-acetyltransferase
MAESEFETKSLRLVPHAPEHLRALINGPEFYARSSGMMPAKGLRDFIVSDAVSPEWLAALKRATAADPWTYGFALVHLESGLVIGNAGFTGPPDAEGIVEIAYGIVPDYQGRGYATEAANALVASAAKNRRVRMGALTDPTDGPIWRWEKQVETA